MYIINLTASTTLTPTHADALCLITGTVTITLPVALKEQGLTYNLKNIGSGTVTINPDASDLASSIGEIDGLTQVVLANKYETLNITSDKYNWYRHVGIPVEG